MLPGGPAAKLGSRYETWWTVAELLRMLDGSTKTLRIEVPGIDKAEFVVTTESRRELHQAKRSNPKGRWSLDQLRAEGLLSFIGTEVTSDADRFVFVSGSEARELSELCAAAVDAESQEEFQRSFLSAKARNAAFRILLVEWKCGVGEAMERLRRINVRTIDEQELKEKAGWQARALFTADSSKVLAELRAIAEDSVHRTITRHALVKLLAQRGYQLRVVRSPEQAIVAVESATKRYADAARKSFISGSLVPRSTSADLLSRLNGPLADNVLTGTAGSGKTACIVEVVDNLQARRIPVLALRLDRVPPSVSTTTALGDLLGLEESPVLVLAAAAEESKRPSVLIVDQLDVVSTMSSRSSHAFDLIEQLLHEARGIRRRVAIHTLVVCRAFDWSNDSRLRKLMPDDHSHFELEPFTADDVGKLLIAAGFAPTSFQTRQIVLLGLPQNLSLFLEAGFDPTQTPSFGTATELFDRYWTAKRHSVEARVTPSPDRWDDVIKTLCDEMTATQQLFVSRERLDNVSPGYLQQLASEGVITFDGDRYGFGHESFFDYCFARVFVSRPQPLVSFLMSTEQHVFRRAQVRQVLAYLRDKKFSRYIHELRQLLSDTQIRLHIKDLAFSLLAEVVGPTTQEWTLWQNWIAPVLNAIENGTTHHDKVSQLAWRRFFGSQPWFPMVDQSNLVQQWLASGNDTLADEAMKYLWTHHLHSPDRVAAILKPYADCGGKWRARFRTFMERATLHTSRSLFELFLSLLDSGDFDADPDRDRADSFFGNAILRFENQRLDWATEVLGHRLQRRLATIRTSGNDLRHTNPLGLSETATIVIRKSANRDPVAFVKHVMPPVLSISDSALVDDDPPKRDAVWLSLIKTKHPRAEDACLIGLGTALRTLAGKRDPNLHDIIDTLRCRETYVANYLLIALYLGDPARYADDTASLLCHQPWRFQCGFSDSPNWFAMELVRETIRHCSNRYRNRLETVILGYLSPFERTIEGRRYKEPGRTRLRLLSAIPEELRSNCARRHFGELTRRFPERIEEPRGIVVRRVTSPIDRSAIERMTDDQWLRAITKYDTEHSSLPAPEPFKGGALELARELENRVKEDPARFARLSLRFPSATNRVYMQHTLAGLRDADVDNDLKLQVCRRAFSESCSYSGKWIADVLGGIKDRLPDDAVEMLSFIATKHEDPNEDAWLQDSGNGQPFYNGDILTNGINTTRGRAADAIRTLVLADAEYLDRFRSTIELMTRDRSTAVLACVVGLLSVVAYRDPVLGITLFKGMNFSEERLLSTDYVCEFIRNSVGEHFLDLRPIVRDMLGSSYPEVCEAGARVAAIAALANDCAERLVAIAMKGSRMMRTNVLGKSGNPAVPRVREPLPITSYATWIRRLSGHLSRLISRLLSNWVSDRRVRRARRRLGVGRVAAYNVAIPEYRRWCEAKLMVLFEDRDSDVRSQAASCFNHLGTHPLATYEGLIRKFCASMAFTQGADFIIHVLEESREPLPGISCLVCEKYLDCFEHTLGVAKLIFRTYHQHKNDEWTPRLLDLIDRLVEGGPGPDSEFEQFDR